MKDLPPKTVKLRGSDAVTSQRPRPALHEYQYRIKGLELRDVHHDALNVVANRMRAESEDGGFDPTYQQAIRYAVQMAGAEAARQLQGQGILEPARGE